VTVAIQVYGLRTSTSTSTSTSPSTIDTTITSLQGQTHATQKPLPSQGRKGLPSVVPPCLAHSAGQHTGCTMHPLSAVTGSPEPACCPSMGHQPVDSPATFGGAQIVGGSHPVAPILWRRLSAYSSGSQSLLYRFTQHRHYSVRSRRCQMGSRRYHLPSWVPPRLSICRLNRQEPPGMVEPAWLARMTRERKHVGRPAVAAMLQKLFLLEAGVSRLAADHF